MSRNVRLDERRLRKLVRDKIIETLSEVRYIDPTIRNKKGGGFSHEPLRNDETIRVYHGLGSIEDAVLIAKYGTSGKDFHPRKYSYENGMNPHGIFVTVNPETFPDFASGHSRRAAIEFSCKVTDLDFPVWNGQDTFFGQGSNPQPFRNKAERDRQRRHYTNIAKDERNPAYVRYSDNPALANSLMNNAEFQALFVGDLNPNMIKRVWVQEGNTTVHWEKYSVKQFLKKYGDIKVPDYLERYHNWPQSRLFLPNEDFTSIEDAAKRIYGDDTSQDDVRQLADIFEQPEAYLSDIRMMFWPKQIIQYKGEDYFRKHFSRFYDNPEYSQWGDGERQNLPQKYQRLIFAAQKMTSNSRLPIIFDGNGNGKDCVDKQRAKAVMDEIEGQQKFLLSLWKQYGENFSVADAKEVYMRYKGTEHRTTVTELYQYVQQGYGIRDLSIALSEDYKKAKATFASQTQDRIEKVEVQDGMVTVSWNRITLDDWGCTTDEEKRTEQFPLDSLKAKTFALKIKKNQDLQRWYSRDI